MQKNVEKVEISEMSAEALVLGILNGFIAGSQKLTDKVVQHDPEADLFLDPTWNGVSAALDLLCRAFVFLTPGALSDPVLMALNAWLGAEKTLVDTLIARYGRCRQFHDALTCEKAFFDLVRTPWEGPEEAYSDKLRERLQDIKEAYHDNAQWIVGTEARAASAVPMPDDTEAVTRALASVQRGQKRVENALADREEHCWDRLRSDVRRQQVLDVWRRCQDERASGRKPDLYRICHQLYGSCRMALKAPPKGTSRRLLAQYGYPNADALYAFCHAHRLEF